MKYNPCYLGRERNTHRAATTLCALSASTKRERKVQQPLLHLSGVHHHGAGKEIGEDLVSAAWSGLCLGYQDIVETVDG